MPETISAILYNVTTWFVAAGVSPDVAWAAVTLSANAAASIGLSYGVTAAMTPGASSSGDVKTPLRQSIPPRFAGYGEARCAGAYLCFEEKDGVSYDVLAFHDGPIDSILHYYLHDDEVSVVDGAVQGGADGRYGHDKIHFTATLGAAVGVPNAAFVAALGADDVWTADHRGDGLARIDLSCVSVDAEDFSTIYPFQLPSPSVAARLQRVFDPRDPEQAHDDPETWTWSANPVLHLMHYFMVERGFVYARRFAPTIDAWIAAANVCDEPVALAAGGTEPRYRAGGVYRRDATPSAVVTDLLTTFDGWIGERGDGAINIVAGVYVEPTVALGPDHIYDYTVQRFQLDEDAINVYNISFTSPTHNWAEVEAQQWRDEADIAARGKERQSPLQLTWVQSFTQARRLAKRKMIRARGARVSLRTTFAGIDLLGERYISVDLSDDLPSMAGYVGEVERVEIDLANMCMVFDLVGVTPDIDDWTPETDEGSPPAPLTTTTQAPFTAPANFTAAAEGVALGHTPITGARIRASFDAPAREDLAYVLRWRVADEGLGSPGPWQEAVTTDVDAIADVITLLSPVLASSAIYEVEAAFLAPAGARSPWSETEMVDTALADIPAKPTSLSATGGSGEALIEWRNSTSLTLDQGVIFRGASSDFGAASEVHAAPAALGAVDDWTDTGLSAGAYYYWAVSRGADGDSDPAGPEIATVS